MIISTDKDRESCQGTDYSCESGTVNGSHCLFQAVGSRSQVYDEFREVQSVNTSAKKSS